jgi:mannitol-specific phosphotransferase system IIBC component
MKNFLEKLRQKNEAQKTMIALIASAVITFVIASSWFTWTVTKEEEKIVQSEQKTERITPISNLNSQFSEIKSMVSEFNTQLKESKELLKEVQNSTTTLQIESSTE